jgi:hypothetical protein
MLLRDDQSPLTVAFNDPLLRAEGLKSDRFGDAIHFFQLTQWEAHELLCDCHYIGPITSAMIARRARMIGNRQSFGELLERAYIAITAGWRSWRGSSGAWTTSSYSLRANPDPDIRYPGWASLPGDGLSKGLELSNGRAVAKPRSHQPWNWQHDKHAVVTRLSGRSRALDAKTKRHRWREMVNHEAIGEKRSILESLKLSPSGGASSALVSMIANPKPSITCAPAVNPSFGAHLLDALRSKCRTHGYHRRSRIPLILQQQPNRKQ